MTTTKSHICVRYAETDQMGIVHHAVYPVWFEVARTDFIKVIGVTYTEMEQMGIFLPLSDLTAKYKIPARYEDALTVETRIARITPARIQFAYRVYKDNDPDETTMAEGTTTHGWVSSAMRPINMKKAHPALYEKIAALAE